MENNEREYTDQDILKAVVKLPRDYQDILLTNLTVYNIKNIINSKKDYEDFYSDYIYKAYCCSMLASAMKELYETIDSKLEEDTKDLSEEYDELNDSDKKRVALEMLNDTGFQKSLYELILGDLKESFLKTRYIKP